MADCYACATRKSHLLVYPKMVNQRVKHPFRLVFTDLVGPITPEGLEDSEYVDKEFKDCRLQTGVSLEFTSTNTPQQIDMSYRIGRTLAARFGLCLPTADCQSFYGKS